MYGFPSELIGHAEGKIRLAARREMLNAIGLPALCKRQLSHITARSGLENPNYRGLGPFSEKYSV